MSLLRSLWWLFLGAATTIALTACGPRPHLSPDYGRATEAWLREQRISTRPEPGSPLGLDSEEASTVLKGYRKQMGGGGEEAKDSPSRVLLLQDTKETPK
jgi:hypothetical protein